MPASTLTLTFTATPTLRGTKLEATVVATGNAAPGGLPYLQADKVEYWWSLTNNFATALEADFIEGSPDAVHAGLIEETTYYYWAFVRDVSGNKGAMYPASPTGGVSVVAIGISGLTFGPANGKITASVAANALTVALKTKAGNDPSATDSIFLAQPGTTLTTGEYQIRQIATAVSLTVSNGSALGIANTNVAFSQWLLLFDDVGTPRLGIVNRSSQDGGILSLPETGIASSTAEGGVGGADGNLIYTAVAVTSKPYRIIGYLVWSSGLAAVGVWNVGPDVVRLTTPGVIPGSVVQENFDFGGGGSTTSIIPSDITIPQISEGGPAGLDVPITPTSAANLLEIDVLVHASASVAGEVIIALFKNSESDATAVAVGLVATADKYVPISMKVVVIAGSTSQIGWSVRFGPAGASTAVTGGAKFQGRHLSSIRVRELRG